MDNGNNQALFEIKTVDSEKTHSDFMFFENLVHSGNALAAIFSIVFFILIAVFMIVSTVFMDGRERAFMLLLIVAYCIFMPLMIWQTLKGRNRGGYIGDKYFAFRYAEKYLFYDDSIIAFDNASQLTISCKALSEAYETKQYFYIYDEHQKAHIIEKSGFVVGNPNEMRNYLRKRLGDKFHIRIKKSDR